ncbi:MG284/MPN403 family protein [Metamycoplasma gateae]|uniref:Uncharacterized protein n=1 Tax=Metamycoplasma gateae TaxID=35769 RepID=A0ABZ2ALH0_9BACT|nr:hypothetical protein V2E26_01125 [Metamycoplasma gateae]
MLEDKIEKIKNMSLQSKREFIYNFCLNQKLKQFQNSKNNIRNINMIDFFINSLSEDYKKIFIEDFLTKKTDPYWYLENWSKNSYYKKINYLVNLFIDYVNCS